MILTCLSGHLYSWGHRPKECWLGLLQRLLKCIMSTLLNELHIPALGDVLTSSFLLTSSLPSQKIPSASLLKRYTPKPWIPTLFHSYVWAFCVFQIPFQELKNNIRTNSWEPAAWERTQAQDPCCLLFMVWACCTVACAPQLKPRVDIQDHFPHSQAPRLYIQCDMEINPGITHTLIRGRTNLSISVSCSFANCKFSVQQVCFFSPN